MHAKFFKMTFYNQLSQAFSYSGTLLLRRLHYMFATNMNGATPSSITPIICILLMFSVE